MFSVFKELIYIQNFGHFVFQNLIFQQTVACTLISTKIFLFFLFQETSHAPVQCLNVNAEHSTGKENYLKQTPSTSRGVNRENLIPDDGDITQTPSTSRGPLQTPEKNTPSRWRQTNVNRRLKNKRKLKRNLGHSYKTSRGKEVEAREIGQSCTCKNRCRQLLQGKENDIFHSFWNLGNYDRQNIHLFSIMKAVPKKRTYKKKCKKNVSSRKFNIHYFVKVNGIDVKICKEEFAAVHGLQRSRKRLQLLCKQIASGSSTPSSDRRGTHHNRKNRISQRTYDSITEHIDAIPKYSSHYSRQKNPGKVYLDHDLNISALYKDHYVSWCEQKGIEPASEDMYRRVFSTKFNIGFKLPKSDTCKTCDRFMIQLQDEKLSEEQKKAISLQKELHLRRASALQDNLKQETENARISKDICVISFDLQQALPVPNLTVGPAFYLRKAWVYNLGIHDCGTGKGYMYMWSEHTAKRGSDEISSILYKHFKENRCEAKKLICFSDNCSGQNKNWSMICLWQNLIKSGMFESVEHRYLVVGHTQLPSDRDFAIIEKYKRHYLKSVYVPQDWYRAVQNCKRTNPFKVVEITQEDILNFKDLQAQITKKSLTDDKEKLKFSKICWVKFDHANPNLMLIKHYFNEKFKTCNIGKRGQRNAICVTLQDLKRKYTAPIPLNPKKLANLTQLLPFIPPIYMEFYEAIGAVQGIQQGQLELDNNVEEIDNFSDLSDDNDIG